MCIPTREECFALMERTAMPPHIRRHSLMVAEIALYLGRRLEVHHTGLDLRMVEAGALLHDIGKMPAIASGERHEELGARMLRQWGLGLLAPIVEEHVTLDWSRIHGPITESLIVNYADKRVKHDQVVTIEDRFADLVDRYAKTGSHRVRLREKLEEYRMLERRIFDQLVISPEEGELMTLSLGRQGLEGAGRENDEQQTIESGIVGGW